MKTSKIMFANGGSIYFTPEYWSYKIQKNVKNHMVYCKKVVNFKKETKDKHKLIGNTTKNLRIYL